MADSDPIADADTETPRSSEVNPTLSNTGSGATLVILSALAIFFACTFAYVAYQRYWLGRGSSGSGEGSTWEWVPSSFHRGYGSDAYHPVRAGYLDPRYADESIHGGDPHAHARPYLPAHTVPVAYPPTRDVDLADMREA